MKRWVQFILLLVLAGSFLVMAAQEPPACGEASLTADEISDSILASDGTTNEPFPAEEWVWAETPEALGWSSEKLAHAQSYAQTIGSAAVMIVDNGIVVDAWGDVTINYHCHSMRKSLMSALYGIYVADGAIDISKTLEQLSINEIRTPLTQTESRATVADLLKARSGVYLPAAGESDWMISQRPERGSHAPGTFWYYNNWDFNALGTIFDKETGERSIYEAFQDRIAVPVGMQDFRPDQLRYSYVPYSRHPYYGFDVSTRDLARFGLLFLREGRWEDQQIITPNWVLESTMPHSEIGPNSGYGYMWWTGDGTGLFPNVEVAAHSYYASGALGHRVVVLPYRNLVIVHRVDTFALEEEVTEEEFGVLLWLILDAAGESEIGEPPFIDQAPGVRLGEEDLRLTILGKTLRARDGSAQATVRIDPDGTLAISLSGEEVETGTWSLEGDVLIVDVPGTDIGGAFNIVSDGAILRFYEADGVLSMGFTIIEEGH